MTINVNKNFKALACATHASLHVEYLQIKGQYALDSEMIHKLNQVSGSWHFKLEITQNNEAFTTSLSPTKISRATGV